MSGLLAILLQEIHVQVTRRFNPVFVRLDGQRADQAQTTVRIRKDPHHQRPPFDFFVQPLQHIRRLQVFVMRPRQFVEAQGLQFGFPKSCAFVVQISPKALPSSVVFFLPGHDVGVGWSEAPAEPEGRSVLGRSGSRCPHRVRRRS